MRHLALSRSLICTSPRRACTRRSAPRLHPACTPLLHHLLLHLHYTCTTYSTCSTCTTYVVHSRAFGAILHKTEMQLRYFPSNSSITDMSISLAGVALHVKTNTLAFWLAQPDCFHRHSLSLRSRLCRCHRPRLGLLSCV